MPQGVVLVLLVLAGSFLAKMSWDKKTEARKLTTQWGTDDALKMLEPELLQDAAEYWQKKKVSVPGGSQVDDITWNDLSMDDVFRGIDATQSITGSEVLYAMLRHTGTQEERLEQRRKAAQLLQQDEGTRIQVQKALRRITRGHFHGAQRYLWNVEFMYPSNRHVYLLLAILLLLSIALSIFIPRLFTLVIIMMAVNAVVYYKFSPSWRKEEVALKYLSSVIGAANAMEKIQAPAIRAYLDDIYQANNLLKPVLRWVPVFSVNGTTLDELLIDYLKIFFLFDVFAYCRIIRHLINRQVEIRLVFETVGEIDSCLALAQMMQRNEDICKPRFHTQHTVQAEHMLHPLVKNCVPNRFTWDENILLTGSNASGKSTFIKAVALNAILAQTLGICFAHTFIMPRARVMTSMAIRDDVQAGDSYFIKELKSLKRIADASREEGFLLCFIDEILRGTNTQERISASSALLENLAEQRLLCMAATHDIELTKILEASYHNWHFREEMEDGRISFTFTLHDGPATSRNAISLLEQMGFEAEVISKARSRAADFDAHGTWR